MHQSAVVSRAIAAGVLHSAAALHHLRELIAADALLSAADASALAEIANALAAMAGTWEALAEGERKQELAKLLGLDAD
jgi:hypothetical protein